MGQMRTVAALLGAASLFLFGIATSVAGPAPGAAPGSSFCYGTGGPLTAVAVSVGGSNGPADGTITNVSATGQKSGASDALVSVTIAGGAITAVTPTSYGGTLNCPGTTKGYYQFEDLTLTDARLGSLSDYTVWAGTISNYSVPVPGGVYKMRLWACAAGGSGGGHRAGGAGAGQCLIDQDIKVAPGIPIVFGVLPSPALGAANGNNGIDGGNFTFQSGIDFPDLIDAGYALIGGAHGVAGNGSTFGAGGNGRNSNLGAGLGGASAGASGGNATLRDPHIRDGGGGGAGSNSGGSAGIGGSASQHTGGNSGGVDGGGGGGGSELGRGGAGGTSGNPSPDVTSGCGGASGGGGIGAGSGMSGPGCFALAW